MSNREAAEAIAILRGINVDTVEQQVNTLIFFAMSDIHSLVPGFWTKVNETFTLGASGTSAYLIDLIGEFPDFWSLRMLSTADGPINYIPEKQFRLRVPDPASASAGIPNRYFFREKSLVEVFPRNSASRTIYISYRYKPSFTDISSMPEEWQFVPFYYLMSMFESQDSNFFKIKYANGLKRMQNFAKESEEEHSVIISDGQDEIIYDEIGGSGR